MKTDLIYNWDRLKLRCLSFLVSISVEHLTVPSESHFCCWFQRVTFVTFLHLTVEHWQLTEEPEKENHVRILSIKFINTCFNILIDIYPNTMNMYYLMSMNYFRILVYQYQYFTQKCAWLAITKYITVNFVVFFYLFILVINPYSSFGHELYG